MAGIWDKPLDMLAQRIAGYMMPADKKRQDERDYFIGDHERQLKVKSGQYDDNLTLNYIGLAIARDVSRLFRGGVEFNLPKGADAQQEYLDAVWDTNKEEQLLHQLGLNGAVYGTPFLKIVPDGITNRLTGASVPRLIALDPEITHADANPFDVDEIEQYRIEFTVGDVAYKEVTRHSKPGDYAEMPNEAPETWIIEHFILSKNTSGKWIPDPEKPPVEWPYNFPPIMHWKNLPSLKNTHGCYGSTDMQWATGAQDKLNFADSNINKTIRLNAAPPTIVTGTMKEPTMSSGPGSLSWFTDPNTKVFNLTANADIAGSRAFAGDLQTAVFELMREVPPAVIAQLGSGLTNFVMRVIYSDAIDKTDTKRELYGDALLEINRRLLVLNGAEGEAANPGMIVWGEPLPTNPTEQDATNKFLLDNKLVSRQTVAAKYGVDYEAEKALIDTDTAASTDNVGAFLLNNFNKGAQ